MNGKWSRLSQALSQFVCCGDEKKLKGSGIGCDDDDDGGGGACTVSESLTNAALIKASKSRYLLSPPVDPSLGYRFSSEAPLWIDTMFPSSSPCLFVLLLSGSEATTSSEHNQGWVLHSEWHEECTLEYLCSKDEDGLAKEEDELSPPVKVRANPSQRDDVTANERFCNGVSNKAVCRQVFPRPRVHVLDGSRDGDEFGRRKGGGGRKQGGHRRRVSTS